MRFPLGHHRSVHELTRANLEQILDRWRHAPERARRKDEIFARRAAEKFLREARSVYAFGTNSEGQLGQFEDEIARGPRRRSPANVGMERDDGSREKSRAERTKLQNVTDETDSVDLIERRRREKNLARGQVKGSLFPRRVASLHDQGVISVYSGFSCSMAAGLTEDGDLYLWGGRDVTKLCQSLRDAAAEAAGATATSQIASPPAPEP